MRHQERLCLEAAIELCGVALARIADTHGRWCKLEVMAMVVVVVVVVRKRTWGVGTDECWTDVAAAKARRATLEERNRAPSYSV